MTIVTRVAPSPTGDPHVGTAFVAVLNMLHAKAHGGTFLLRIEDTDRARSTASSEAAILDALRWLGISWDEGPDVGGPNGPYRQSERLAIYEHHTNVLLDKGHAFRCFCTPADLDAMRAAAAAAKKPPRYDGRCAGLDPAVSAARAAAGEPHVVRMHVPTEGSCVFTDRLRGELTFAWADIDAQVLRKSDGWPTYHLANVVDDHLMGVTDVIRGEEWIPSTPKHVLLYRMFGWEPPRWAHLPLLRNPDKSKLSKRKNPTGILHYRHQGVLPEVLAGFLAGFATKGLDGALLGDRDAVAKAFDLDTLSVGGPVFDVAKLDWLNGQVLRAMPPEDFQAAVRAWMGDKAGAALGLAQNRITRLGDLPGLVGPVFAAKVAPEKAAILDGKLAAADLVRALDALHTRLDAAGWTVEAIGTAVRAAAEDAGTPMKHLGRHLTTVFLGAPQGLPLFDALALMGRDAARARLAHARSAIA
jgi:glutamyl-tRNA synthetase